LKERAGARISLAQSLLRGRRGTGKTVPALALNQGGTSPVVER
jgi:hypothetical protein